MHDRRRCNDNFPSLNDVSDASKIGVTLEVFDKSFGDTALLSADVCFQACSISPWAAPQSDSSRAYYGGY